MRAIVIYYHNNYYNNYDSCMCGFRHSEYGVNSMIIATLLYIQYL